MIANALLALLSAAMALDAPADARSAEASLGVTATVVRPLHIAAVSTRAEGTVVTLANAAEVEVRAEGGRVARPDADTVTVTASSAGRVAITIIY